MEGKKASLYGKKGRKRKNQMNSPSFHIDIMVVEYVLYIKIMNKDPT